MKTLKWTILANLLAAGFAGGCGNAIAPPQQQKAFYLPMSVQGRAIQDGLVDTGGEFEVLLKQPFGLSVVSDVEVLAFSGKERVQVTEPFVYTVSDFTLLSDGAIVGLSTCDCNGVGVRFFQKTKQFLKLDFPSGKAQLLETIPDGGIALPFVSPPVQLSTFEGVFMNVEVNADGVSTFVKALVDSGATITVLRRGLVGTNSVLLPDNLDVTVTHPNLGTVAISVGLFDTEGLPDLIVGTDLMAVWGDQWYLHFTNGDQPITVFPTGVIDNTGGAGAVK